MNHKQRVLDHRLLADYGWEHRGRYWHKDGGRLERRAGHWVSNRNEHVRELGAWLAARELTQEETAPEVHVYDYKQSKGRTERRHSHYVFIYDEWSTRDVRCEPRHARVAGHYGAKR